MNDVSTLFRPTVAGLVVRPGTPFPLIAIHWPQKAAQEGEYNLTTAGGGIEPGETPEDAMRRELREEYGVVDACITPLTHPDWRFHGKQYYWCLVECRTNPQLVAQDGVASVGWYASPGALAAGVRLMHETKRMMFVHVLATVLAMQEPLFLPYRRFAAMQRKARRCPTL